METISYTYSVTVTVPVGNEAGDVADTISEALAYTVESGNPWDVSNWTLTQVDGEPV